MSTLLIPQEIFLLERYTSADYFGKLRDTWAEMIAHLDRYLDEFMRNLPLDYRNRPLANAEEQLKTTEEERRAGRAIATDSLTPERACQVAMLYHYASLDYMKHVDRVLSHIINDTMTPEIERRLAQAYAQVMQDAPRAHDVPKRWECNMRGYLSEMQAFLWKDIAGCVAQRYRSGSLKNFLTNVGRADVYENSHRRVDEYLVCEMLLSDYISFTDKILLDQQRYRPIDDEGFARQYDRFIADQPSIPKFQVRTDIMALSDQVPPRAGVYINADDPTMAPQFAWPGGDFGRLRDPAETTSGSRPPLCWYFVEIVQ